MTVNAFLSIAQGAEPIGKLELELYDDVVPKTVQNFVSHMQNNKYTGTKFHRIIRNFMAQGGDFENGDGTGGSSIYGKTFPDENFRLGHSQRGVLAMANAGKDTNGSQFYITFRATSHLDQKHVVFGQVVGGMDVLARMEKAPTGARDVPKKAITIIDCGVMSNKDGNDEKTSEAAAGTSKSNNDDDNGDGNEIDLDDDGNDKGVDEAPEEPPHDPSIKPGSLKDRMRKLKMKMNQARQLNRKEVLREGERLGSEEGRQREKQRQLKKDKKRRDADFVARNAKALQVAEEAGIAGKHLVEQAGDSMRKANRKADQNEMNRFSVNDYHNPEGQHRNYARNLRSLPKDLERSGDETFDPIAAATNDGSERAGAKRLANEMKRRIEKQQNKRQKTEFEQTDVSHINQRNQRFNQKISRTYDKATAEIRQNLERGTAL